MGGFARASLPTKSRRALLGINLATRAGSRRADKVPALHLNRLRDLAVLSGDYSFRLSKRGLMLLKLVGEEVENWDKYFPRSN